jgi:hypothetical protein
MQYCFNEKGDPIFCVDSPEVQQSGAGRLYVDSPLEAAYVLLETYYDFDKKEIVYRGGKPPHHEWDWPTKSWLPNLDAAREAQRQAWNAWRDRELVAGYAHNGHVFHSDDRFIAELQLILKGYERGYLTGTSAIRTLDNSTLQMTHAEIESLLLLIGLHRQAIYAQSWTGKDALASLTTLEDIVAGGPPE